MDIVPSGKVRILVVARFAGLFILAVIAIAFFASRVLPFAAKPPQDSTICGGPDGSVSKGLPTATLVKAFTLNGPSGSATLKPDLNFDPTVEYPPETGLEVLQIKLNNDQTVFALFRGKGIAMTFQGIEVQFAKIDK